MREHCPAIEAECKRRRDRPLLILFLFVAIVICAVVYRAQGPQYIRQYDSSCCRPVFGFNVLDRLNYVHNAIVNAVPCTAIIFPKLSQHVERWPRWLVIAIDLVLVGCGLVLLGTVKECPLMFIPAIVLLVLGYWFIFSTPVL